MRSKDVGLHPGQWAALQSQARFTAIVAGTGGGKCMDPSTPILMEDGRLLEISKVRAGDVVFRKSETGEVVPCKVTDSFPSGERATIRLTTTSGRRAVLTPEHPVWTLGGWVPVGSLSEGDFIAVPRSYPDVGTRSYPRRLLRIIGYLIGDGCNRSTEVGFSNITPEVIEDMKSCLPEPCKLRRRSGPNWAIVGRGRGKASHNPILEHTKKDWGLYGKYSYEKEIPSFVFTLPKNLVAEVLSTYFACDGWVTERGFGISTSSESLARQVQHLLLRFGILSRLRSKKTNRRDAWVLSVRGRENALRFNAAFDIPGKPEIPIKGSSTNTDYVPDFPVGICWDLLDYSDREGYSLLRNSRRYPITRDRALKLSDHFEVGSKQATSDIFWDSISEIIPLGKREVWDLTIEQGRNFVAADIFCHNTWFGPKWLYQEIASHPSEDWMVVAPTNRLLFDAAVDELVDFFTGTDMEGEIKIKRGIYYLPDGGRIFLRSADKPRSIEALHLQGIWADEAGLFSRWAWVILQNRVGIKEGRILITTTPYNMGWLYREVYKHARVDEFEADGSSECTQAGEDPETFQVVSFPSTLNPRYKEEEFERMRSQLTPAEFNMRHRGKFEQIEGLVYPNFETCVRAFDPYSPMVGDLRIGGLDPGISDPFAAITAIYGADDKLHLKRELYQPDLLLRDVLSHLDTHTAYYMDPAARREREELGALGLDVRQAINDVRPGVLKVREFFSDQRVVIPEDDFPQLIEESATYKFKASEDLPDRSSPHHLMDVLRYLIMGLEDDTALDIYLL